METVTGEVFHYPAIWQRKNLVLVTGPRTALATEYVRSLRERDADFNDRNSVCVVTHDRVAGLPGTAALVADRWGEVIYVATPASAASLPAAQDLLDWVEHLEHRCPECEGEAY